MDSVFETHLASFLAQEKSIRVRKNVPISMLTSIGIGGDAAFVLSPFDSGSLIRLLDFLSGSGVRYRVIGKGTNLIGPDEGYDGVLVLTESVDRVSVFGTSLHVGAGVPLSRAIRYAKDAGLSGLENLYGIPGTVGGALYMNAGAYGSSISDRLCHATVYHPESREITVRAASEIAFGYRSSAFAKDGTIVLSAAFTLTRGDPDRISETMNAVLQKRKESQPLDYPSAGCVFRRPTPDSPLGRMIRDAGMAGVSVGGAQVSTMHAGFIVNLGGATEGDVRKLVAEVRDAVRDKNNFELTDEIEFLSDLGTY